MEWRPIETAPKNGRWLLLAGRGDGKAHIGTWAAGYEDGEFSHDGRWEKDGEGLELHHIDVWMPLPEPPK